MSAGQAPAVPESWHRLGMMLSTAWLLQGRTQELTTSLQHLALMGLFKVPSGTLESQEAVRAFFDAERRAGASEAALAIMLDPEAHGGAVDDSVRLELRAMVKCSVGACWDEVTSDQEMHEKNPWEFVHRMCVLRDAIQALTVSSTAPKARLPLQFRQLTLIAEALCANVVADWTQPLELRMHAGRGSQVPVFVSRMAAFLKLAMRTCSPPRMAIVQALEPVMRNLLTLCLAGMGPEVHAAAGITFPDMDPSDRTAFASMMPLVLPGCLRFYSMVADAGGCACFPFAPIRETLDAARLSEEQRHLLEFATRELQGPMRDLTCMFQGTAFKQRIVKQGLAMLEAAAGAWPQAVWVSKIGGHRLQKAACRFLWMCCRHPCIVTDLEIKSRAERCFALLTLTDGAAAVPRAACIYVPALGSPAFPTVADVWHTAAMGGAAPASVTAALDAEFAAIKDMLPPAPARESDFELDPAAWLNERLRSLTRRNSVRSAIERNVREFCRFTNRDPDELLRELPQ